MRNYCVYRLPLSLGSRRISCPLRAALIMHALPRGLLVLGGPSGPCVPHCVRRCRPGRCVDSYFVLRLGLRPNTFHERNVCVSRNIRRATRNELIREDSVHSVVHRTPQRFASRATPRVRSACTAQRESDHAAGASEDPGSPRRGRRDRRSVKWAGTHRHRDDHDSRSAAKHEVRVFGRGPLRRTKSE